MTKLWPPLLAAASILACAAAPPRPAAPAAPPAAPVAARAAPPDALLDAVPAGVIAAVYADVGALMRDPALQVLWPLVAYQPYASATRAACGERFWEQAPQIRWVTGAHESDRGDSGAMVIAAGPIAAEAGRACAEQWFSDPARRPTFERTPDGGRRVLAGAPGLVARQRALAEGAETLGASESFAGMTAPLERVVLEAVLDVAASRARDPDAWREAAPLARDLIEESRRVRALRVEVAEAEEGRLRVRLVARYASDDQAGGSAERLGRWFGRGIPAWLTLRVGADVRDARERAAMLAAMSEAYARWMRGLYAPRVLGRDVIVETTTDRGYLLLAAAAAISGLQTATAEAALRERTAEARANVQALARAVADRWGAVPRPRRRLPAAIPMTPPALPGAEAVVDPPAVWEAPAWRALGFRVEGPHRYAYELVSDGRATFTARATGDLDGDGTYAVFAITGRVAPDGSLALDPMTVENELE